MLKVRHLEEKDYEFLHEAEKVIEKNIDMVVIILVRQ